MTEQEVTIFNKANVCNGLSPKGYGQTHFAKRDFKAGEEISRGFGRIVKKQTSHCSIQIGQDKHFVPKKWTGRYWNHSCNPNAYAKTRADGFVSLFALRKIKKDEEITYAYYMTEFAWGKHTDEITVACKCGEKKCIGKIPSFSELSEKQQTNLMKKGICSSYFNR